MSFHLHSKRFSAIPFARTDVKEINDRNNQVLDTKRICRGCLLRIERASLSSLIGVGRTMVWLSHLTVRETHAVTVGGDVLSQRVAKPKVAG